VIRIGVLALQGSFVEHAHVLRRLGADVREVRLPEDLEDLHGLVIPGGESTTIGKLATRYELMEPLRRFARTRAVWGTCAGMIVLAKSVGLDQPILRLMDIAVYRNAFGRQVDSFETALHVPVLNNGHVRSFPGVFIRAPKLAAVWGKARVIAQLPDETPVAVLQASMLATAFHPELAGDDRFHQFFLELAAR
jgi:5'-phosphate synthase pdxT subunit